jgi:VanZ family protein
MSNNRRGPRFWINTWWPVALMVTLIAISSSSTFGADHTSGPLRWLWQSIFGPVTASKWRLIHLGIRKTGHFLGYGTLGLTWLRAWWLTFPRSRFLADAVLAVLGTAMIASSDEFHQTFLPNRGGSPWDVLLDCCGAVFMCLLVYTIVRLARPKKLRRTA